MKKLLLLLVIVLLNDVLGNTISAQTSIERPVAPADLPGKGLKQYDFFYAGEAKSRNMYIVRNGQVTWSYIDTTGRGEISDAILMKNGDVLFAHQYGVTLIDRYKKVLWQYQAPEGTETHTAQLIGREHVVLVQNGNPAKVLVINIKTNQVEKEFAIPFKSDTHGQIRHARLTRKGTLLVAHMDLGKINEYDYDGKLISSIDEPSVWSAVPLKSGNLLTASNRNIVKEIAPNGSVIWELPLAELPGYSITSPQIALRLPNGNTLINNWFNQWSSKLDLKNPPVQAIEVTPEKKIVWALRSWSAPNLGPSTTIQLLDDPNNTYEKAFFGSEKVKTPTVGIVVPIEQDELAYSSGFRFICESARKMIAPSLSAEAAAAKRTQIKAAKCKVLSCNLFFPGNIKIAGPKVNEQQVLGYADSLLRLASQAGLQYLVLGSGESRRLPDEYDQRIAKDQFVLLCKKLAKLAKKHKIMIVLENLNSGETNFLNTVNHAADIVRRVDAPYFKLNADIYHMMREGELPEEILSAGSLIAYCEVAEKQTRSLPGVAGDDFKPYLAALKKINYYGFIFIEGNTKQPSVDVPSSFKYISGQISEVYKAK